MPPESLPLFVGTLIAMCLIEIACAVPLLLRRVKPNGLYGLRTSDTFADEYVWYEANAAFGRDLLVLALVQLAALLVPLLFPLKLGYYMVGNVALVLVGTLVIGAIAVARAHFMRKRRSTGDAYSRPFHSFGTEKHTES